MRSIFYAENCKYSFCKNNVLIHKGVNPLKRKLKYTKQKKKRNIVIFSLNSAFVAKIKKLSHVYQNGIGKKNKHTHNRI